MRHLVFRCLLLALWALTVRAADAAEVVGRFAENFGQLKIIPEAPVGYTVRISGGSLILRFDLPQKIDPAKIRNALPQLISDAVISGDERSLIIGLNYPVKLEHGVVDNAITIKLLPLAEGAASTIEPLKIEPPPPPSELIKAKQLLQLRAAQHPDYYRLVFEWKELTTYQLQANDQGFIVIFDRGTSLVDGQLARLRPPHCQVAEPIIANERTQFTVACDKIIAVNHFARDKLTVVDIRIIADAPVQENPLEAAASAEQPTPTPTLTVPTDPKQEQKFALPKAERAQILNAEPEPPVAVPESASPPATVPAAIVDQSPPVIEVNQTKTSLDLRVLWPNPVAAAVFKRGEQIWLVFDQITDPPLRLDDFAAVSPIGEVSILSHPQASIVVIQTVSAVVPRVLPESDARNWRITFSNQPLRPSISIPVDLKTIDRQANLNLLVNLPGNVLSVRDPVIGDDLLVGPTQSVARGINGLRNFAQFDLLPTTQGVAVQPKSPDLSMRQEFDGFFISSQGGLSLARGEEPQATAPSADPLGLLPLAVEPSVETYGPNIGRGVADAAPILNYVDWRGNPQQPYIAKELALLAELAALEPEARTAKRLELAKLYFAHGWMSEALGVLGVLIQNEDNAQRQAEVQAIRGVSELYAHNFKAAREALMDLRFDTQPDLATWRAVLALQSNDWSAAQQYFSISDHPNASAPPNLRKLAMLARIETELNNNNTTSAQKLVTAARGDIELPNAAEILDYWQGEILLRQDQPDAARKLWQAVVASEDAFARPRAEFALIKLSAATEAQNRQEIIARLERLRFAWRGDRFEFGVLKMLGEMQIQDGLYRDGLYNLRRAVTNYADQPYAEELSRLMVQTFQKLFLEGSVDQMPPVAALALFDEFRDLTPTGPEGDKIIQKLVERLISVDLLDRAAELLQHQVNYRLQGEEKARIGAKLALVYLMDRKSTDALKAIESSNAPEISAGLFNERRLLRARALFDLNRANEALNLIADINTNEANMLRADLNWRLRNWPAAIDELERLLQDVKDQTMQADAKVIAPEVSRLIVSLALANALAGNDAELRAIKQKYWAMMKPTTDFEVFEIITSVDASRPLSLTELGSKLDAVTRLETFMGYYRDRIKQGGFVTGGN